MPPLIFLLRKVFCFPFSVEQLPRRFHLEKFLRRVRLTHHLFRGIGGQCPPYISFHFFRVGQRPMSNCYEKFIAWCVSRYMIGGTGILPVRQTGWKGCATDAKTTP